MGQQVKKVGGLLKLSIIPLGSEQGWEKAKGFFHISLLAFNAGWYKE